MKPNWNTLAITIVFAILPILMILMLHHITLNNVLSSMDNGTFGDEYVMFSLDEQPSAEDLQTLFDTLKELSGDVALSSLENGENYDIRLLCFHGHYANLPMKSGRFFTEKDFSNDTPLAVIGKDLEELVVYDQNNIPFFQAKGITFRVIGVLGYEQETLWDHTVFLSGTGITASGLSGSEDASADVGSLVWENPVFTLDILSSRNASDTQDAFFARLAQNDLSTTELSAGQSYSSSLLPKVLYARWFLLLLACDVICLILLSIQWLNRKRKNFAIYQMLGMTTGQLTLLIFGEYLLIFLFSFLVGMVYTLLFYPSYQRHFFAGYLLFALIILLFLLATARILRKDNIWRYVSQK